MPSASGEGGRLHCSAASPLNLSFMLMQHQSAVVFPSIAIVTTASYSFLVWFLCGVRLFLLFSGVFSVWRKLF